MNPPPGQYYVYWEHDADYHALIINIGTIMLYDKNDDSAIRLFNVIPEQFYISRWMDYSNWVLIWRKK